MSRPLLPSACLLAIACASLAPPPAHGDVLPALAPFLRNYYSFDAPLGGDSQSGVELDQGLDATNISLFNSAPRIADGAWRGSAYSLETAQRNTGPNDDWKAGVMFTSSAASTLVGTKQVTGVSIMGWFKPLGVIANNPSPNTNTPAAGDYYNAFGLAGYLRGDAVTGGGTDGHAARALLEVISGKVTGLGRRLDGQSGSASKQSVDDWHLVMPPGRWTHLAVSFGFDAGTIDLYKNGLPLTAGAVTSLSNWQLTAGVDRTSNTAAGGIKLAGSYPDNSQEFNPFNGRSDEIMMFSKALTAAEVLAQFQRVSDLPGDYNRDSRVDGGDLLAWQGSLGSTTDLLADGNRDGLVSDLDLTVWSQNYGAVAASAPAGSSIPEPAALALALSSLVATRRSRLSARHLHPRC